ncbi:hypothetical protein PM082_014440 [Marasmius tenuissimus]|nr:hypothetical protein PM082_014440 [Marasmius tenuissimus]
MGTSGIGLLIEAMSILRSMTGSKDMSSRLQETIAWTFDNVLKLSANGVLFNKRLEITDQIDLPYQDDGDLYLLRGLAEAYRRDKGTLSNQLRDNIKIVLGVHYNAVRELATMGDNTCGRNWTGPRPTQVTFDLYNQAAAAQILIDGISLFNISDDTLPPPAALHKPVPAVIGGATVGSVGMVLLIILAVAYMIRRRRRRNETAPSCESDSGASAIEPFEAVTFQKRAAFPQKHPPPESQAQRIVPGPRLSPLRRHNSAPSVFQDPTNSSGEVFGIRNSSNLSGSHNGGPHNAHIRNGGTMETAFTVPVMVRELYQRLLQPNRSESPPDYRSDLEEP